MSKSETFWVIKDSEGLVYNGAYMSKRETIAQHVHGLYRWTERPNSCQSRLEPMQSEDWAKCKRQGKRCIKVRMIEPRP